MQSARLVRCTTEGYKKKLGKLHVHSPNLGSNLKFKSNGLKEKRKVRNLFSGVIHMAIP